MAAQLINYMKYLTFSELVRAVGDIGCANETCWVSQGVTLSMVDLLGIYGDALMPENVQVWFYGGPEKTYETHMNGCADHCFEMVNASALAWAVDMIMYQVSIRGDDVFSELEFIWRS